MKILNEKKSHIRAAILLFIVAVLFGIHVPGAYKQSFGEQLFDKLGLAVYSNGTEGWYYPGIISIVGMVTAIGLFSWTRKKPLKILNLILSIFLVVMFISWMF